MLAEWIARAKDDPAFQSVHETFKTSNVQTWLLESEKALHFAVGAYAPGNGQIVEIGTFQGGSACFLAAGIRGRGEGRLHCVDPHLGGPPWLGMAPHQRTLERFLHGVKHCGVDSVVEPLVGDSSAVAMIWPATPLDTVFIDGDHSFLGALKDFESWAPKVKPGGLVMIDDVNDRCLTELQALLDFIKTLHSVTHLGDIDGIGVYRRNDVSSWEMLRELRSALAAKQIPRAWDMSMIHKTPLPNHFLQKEWKTPGMGDAYQLGFLARCGPGAYGWTPRTPKDDRAFLTLLSEARCDGSVLKITNGPSRFLPGSARPADRFRVIYCHPTEAPALANRLLPGGLLIAHDDGPEEAVHQLAMRQTLIDAGLEGCGFTKHIHWGVWQPHHISHEAILHYASDVA